MMEPIWAKSGRTKTLVDHTKDVALAFETMFGSANTPSRLGSCWARFFRLADYGHFWRTTLASALFHDWGKANTSFQGAVLHRNDQVIWHEHLSALILGLENVSQWVSSRTDIDWDIALSAVLTHHLRARCDGSDASTFAAVSANGTLVEVMVGHEDFHEFMELIKSRLNLKGQKPEIERFWSFEKKRGCVDLVEHREKMIDGRLHSLDKQVGGKRPKNVDRRRLLWAVRSALIAADSVGSAMPRTGTRIEEWLAEVLTPVPACSDVYVWNSVILPRITELRGAGKWNDNYGSDGWSEFQVQTAKLPERALLLAPCGSGKTLAAWRWVAEQCKKPVQRIIFLYPTRATATEGFRDYVSWAPETDAGLMHGTSDVDLQGMFGNPESADARQSKSFAVDAQLYALAYWGRRIFSATIDQFLGFMQYGYSPILMLPLLADSVVVVDEIHSFDNAMFSALKDFLAQFQVPVLCLTATLPEVRKTELSDECGMQVYDDKPGELHSVANASRYTVSELEEACVYELIQDRLLKGKRVLFVVNQVKWVQAWIQKFARSLDEPELKTKDEIPIYCYHSRFRLMDRRERHQQTIRAFQGKHQPCLAVTSQVCEMSLDMDADVLVTQAGPITSLIQRMGRCNRVARPRDDAGEVFVYQPENEKPYSPADLQGLPEFLRFLTTKPRISQVDLETGLRTFGPATTDAPKASSFLQSGPYAVSGDESFRDIDQFTVPAILDCDVSEYSRLVSHKQPTDGLIVPVPKQKKFFIEGTSGDSPRLPPYLKIASGSHYHRILGFCDSVVSTPGASSI
jgi:CRISPR-associated endonuclease/helicase Cas3